MTEQRIKNIEEQITLSGLLPGVDLSCLPMEESAKLKRAVLDIYRRIHASGFRAGADYAMNTIAGDIEYISGMKIPIDERAASSLAQGAPAFDPFSEAGSGVESEPKQAPYVISNSKPANPSKRRTKAVTEAKPKKTRPPRQRRRSRPPSAPGFRERKEGAAGEFQNDFYAEKHELRNQKPP